MRAGLKQRTGADSYMEKMKKRFLGRSVARQQNMSEETARKVDARNKEICRKGL